MRLKYYSFSEAVDSNRFQRRQLCYRRLKKDQWRPPRIYSSRSDQSWLQARPRHQRQRLTGLERLQLTFAIFNHNLKNNLSWTTDVTLHRTSNKAPLKIIYRQTRWYVLTTSQRPLRVRAIWPRWVTTIINSFSGQLSLFNRILIITMTNLRRMKIQIIMNHRQLLEKML